MLNFEAFAVAVAACSGEELPEGTVSRIAARIVLDELRPNRAVTICLPLLLAGGEQDRAFVRDFPTVVIDGCEKRCAEKSILNCGRKPAASILVTEVQAKYSDLKAESRVELGPKGLELARKIAEIVAKEIDKIMGE